MRGLPLLLLLNLKAALNLRDLKLRARNLRARNLRALNLKALNLKAALNLRNLLIFTDQLRDQVLQH